MGIRGIGTALDEVESANDRDRKLFRKNLNTDNNCYFLYSDS